MKPGEQAARKEGRADEGLLRDAARAQVLRRLGPTLRHDLNSPVQAALWAFDLMQRGVASHPDAEQRAKLLTSIELGRNELVRLQAAARLFAACAAPMEETVASFDMCELLGEIATLTAAEASLRDVHVTFDLPAQALAATGVRAHLQLALLHLTLEALDLGAPGGTLVVALVPSSAQVAVRLVVKPKDAFAMPASSSPHETLNGARVVDGIATSHRGHVRREQSTAGNEIEFAIARA